MTLRSSFADAVKHLCELFPEDAPASPEAEHRVAVVLAHYDVLERVYELTCVELARARIALANCAGPVSVKEQVERLATYAASKAEE